MTNDLFAREKEFRRVNRELDERTRHLLEEIDQVVNSETRNMFSPGIPDAFRPQLSMAFDKFYAEPPLDFDSDYHHNKIQDITQDENNCTSPAAGDQIKSTLYGKNEVETSDDGLITFRDDHKSKNHAIIRFLKAKIKLLLSEIETIKDVYKKQCNYTKDLETENKKLNESKDKLYNQITHLKETINKLEMNIVNNQSQLQTSSSEKKTLNKLIDSLRKEIKASNQQSNNLDIRLNRSVEENEKLKNTIKLNKIEEKDLRSQIRQLQDDERQSVKILERRNYDLFQAFKKQSLLVDNLKKQKAFIEASKQIQLTREDFLKILDWKSNDK